MKIVIVGAGEVGRYLSQLLSERGDDVTVIENTDSVAEEMNEQQDVRVILGNGASAKFLEMADVKNCDFFLAMTAYDQLNIVACSIASKLGARNTIARIHDQVYADNSIVNYQDHFNIGFLLNPEALCAAEFAKLIRNPERVAVEDFARGEIEVQRVSVSGASKVLGALSPSKALYRSNCDLSALSLYPIFRILSTVPEPYAASCIAFHCLYVVSFGSL